MATFTEASTPDANHPARDTSTPSRAGSGCCGGAAPDGADACCALDAEVKSAGGSGCGCAPKTTGKKGCC
jgi:hypothetical protein